MTDDYHEIGEKCPSKGCDGVLVRMDDESDGCRCHITPPCSYCVDTIPECNLCGWNQEDGEPYEEIVESRLTAVFIIVFGLSIGTGFGYAYSLICGWLS
jgi:hypothetical protein